MQYKTAAEYVIHVFFLASRSWHLDIKSIHNIARNHTIKRCKALNNNTMDNIDTLVLMFSEIGLDEENRQAFTKIKWFDFDYSEKQNQNEIQVITSNNTKNE
jgi:hypothetical protein